MKNKINPPFYFIVVLIAIVCTYLTLKMTTIHMMYIIPVIWNWIALFLVILGIWVNLWADYLLKSKRTTVKPNETPTSLVTNGPYRISRHPMYLGMTLILLGTSIFLRTLYTFIFPVLFFFIIQYNFIRKEEKNMLDLFPDDYSEYKQKVRPWL